MKEHTANEGPVRIQYKCLVPIYIFPEMNCYFQNRNIMFCLPVPTLIYLWEIYIFPRSVCLFCCSAGNYVDQSLEYINSSQTHECGNWDRGRAIPRKGIHKWNFPCSAGRKITEMDQDLNPLSKEKSWIRFRIRIKLKVNKSAAACRGSSNRTSERDRTESSGLLPPPPSFK